mgnify:CR=1 FL=1
MGMFARWGKHMPYISKACREELLKRPSQTAGELNYAITCLIKQYTEAKGISYSVLNEVVGVLECVKAELYRRVVAPYEDLKCGLNGDVYNLDTKV